MSAADIIDSPCTNGMMFGYDFNFTINPVLLNRVKIKFEILK